MKIGDANDEAESAKQALGEAHVTFTTVLEDAERLINEQVARINEAVSTYNEAVQICNSKLEDIASVLQETWDNRSERWQESDDGQAAQEAIGSIEHFSVEEVEEEEEYTVELPSEPEELLQEVFDTFEEISSL